MPHHRLGCTAGSQGHSAMPISSHPCWLAPCSSWGRELPCSPRASRAQQAARSDKVKLGWNCLQASSSSKSQVVPASLRFPKPAVHCPAWPQGPLQLTTSTDISSASSQTYKNLIPSPPVNLSMCHVLERHNLARLHNKLELEPLSSFRGMNFVKDQKLL